MLRVHLDIAKQRKVVTGAKPRQMRAQIILEGMVRAGCFGEVGGVLVVRVKLDARFFKNRFFGRKRAREFVLRGELFGYDFARFDVGLIEGVDSKD